MTVGLANVVSKKACMLEVKLKNPLTGEYVVCWGQAGLIQAERLTTSPQENPRKRPALVGRDPEQSSAETPTPPPSSLRSSRFAVLPVTCIHNLEDDVTAVGAGTRRMFVINFRKARYTTNSAESVVIRPETTDVSGVTMT